MATLRGLVQMSLEELWQAHVDNRISSRISHHAGSEAIKAVAHIGEHRYYDYGNFPGSLVMLMLLFPEKFLPANEATISLLPVANGQGDRADVLRNEGPMEQSSGTGQNNYRTNLLEALLDHLGDEAQHTHTHAMEARRYLVRGG